jgi:YesN/AraC family two-component response regulator
MKWKIGIIDDEHHAIETLIYDLIEIAGDQVDILFTSNDPFDGARAARISKPDILFLDVVMPGLSGLELYGLVEDLGIRVIFVTAYSENISLISKTKAAGYLLKPVMHDELEQIMHTLI